MVAYRERDSACTVAVAAAKAMLQVRDEIVDLFTSGGNADVIVALRAHSHALSHSAIAHDQIKCRALECAADDLAGGRAPLASWSLSMSEDNDPSTAERLRLRLRVGPKDAADDELAKGLAASLELQVLAEHAGARMTARRLTHLLSQEAQLQYATWDGPRIQAPSDACALWLSSWSNARRCPRFLSREYQPPVRVRAAFGNDCCEVPDRAR